MHNDGRPVDQEMFLRVQVDLVERFGALSFVPQVVRGIWTHEGRRYEDESLRFFLDVDDTPENRAFFAEYKLTLQERFEQIVIYVRSFAVEIL